MHPFQQEERKAREREHTIARIATQAQLQERLMDEELRRFGFKPKCLQVEQLLDKGGELEDAGAIESAIKLYSRALVLEPEHHELRQHIGLLNRRLNALEVLQRHDVRSRDTQQQGEQTQAIYATLQLPSSAGPAPPVRVRANVGYAPQPSPAEWGRQLQAQAAEAAARRKAARKRDAHLDQQIVDVAADAVARQQHDRLVRVENQKLEHNRQQQELVLFRQQEHMRRLMEDMERRPLPPAASPLLGMGERERQRAAAAAAAGVAYNRQRPPSAGPGGRGGYPGGRVDGTNWQQQQQRPASARPSSASPFALGPKQVAVNPTAVRARQQDWYTKHAPKEVPVRQGQRQVTPADHVRPIDRNGIRADRQRA